MEGIESPPLASHSFFKPLLISMIGIMSTTTAILLYHFILVKFCQRSRHQLSNSNPPQPISAQTFGLDEKLVDSIPVLAYDSSLFATTKSSSPAQADEVLLTKDSDDSSDQCVVCLGEFEDGEMVRLLPICNHAFHVPCIDQWFMAHSTCPLCRGPVFHGSGTSSDDIENPVPLAAAAATTSSTTALPAHDHEQQHDDRQLQELQNRVADDDDCVSNYDANYNRDGCSLTPSRLLRHCGSLELPNDERRSCSSSSGILMIRGLKRSLSMDQSFVVAVDRLGGGDADDCYGRAICSTSSICVKSDHANPAGGSIGQLNRVSSRLLTSFSRLRMSKRGGILPY